MYSREFDLTQEEIDWHKEVEINRLEKMEEYCKGGKCLRRFILEYFDEHVKSNNCGNCSVCNKGRKTRLSQWDLDKLVRDIFS